MHPPQVKLHLAATVNGLFSALGARTPTDRYDEPRLRGARACSKQIAAELITIKHVKVSNLLRDSIFKIERDTQ